jgi:mannose-1-phosphate guanylyltransferase
MKAFLLAAGLGTRLRPLTDKIPKCLVTIKGKPLLQIWLELCQIHGVTEILINTHYLPHKVKEYFEVNDYKLLVNKREIKKIQGLNTSACDLSTYTSNHMKVVLSYETELLGSAGTLIANREFVDDEKEFFILYSDNLTNANLTELIRFHRSHGELFTMGLFKTDKPTSCGIAELDEDGRVTSFEEKPKRPKTNLAAAGVYVASPKIFEFFQADQREKVNSPLDLGFNILPKLIGKMYGYVIRDYLLDIGDMESYEKAQKDWFTISNIGKGEAS